MEEQEKKHYVVIQCTVCRRYILAISSNKTRACPYCGKRVVVGKARVISRSRSAGEARLALQKLKMNDPKLDETPRNALLR